MGRESGFIAAYSVLADNNVNFCLVAEVEFTHVPISLAVSRRKKIDPEGWLWSSVLASTGQPRDMT